MKEKKIIENKEKKEKKKLGKRRWVILFLFLVPFLYYLWTGIRYALYEPELSDNFFWVAYHVHSSLSDGLESPEEILSSAQKARISLILLNDHGSPNLLSSKLRMKLKDVYLVGGSEASLPEGRLNFFGAKTFTHFKLPPYPPEAIQDIRDWGGFTVLAYPEDPKNRWNYWEDDLLPDGIEIINASTEFRRLSLGALVKTLLYYPFSPYYFLKNLKRPEFSLQAWDELLRRGKVFGFFASNAHGGFKLGKKLRIKIPSYESSFLLLSLGIRKERKDSLESSVRGGDFFSCVRGAGEPQEFEFYARDNEKIFYPGSDLHSEADLYVKVSSKKYKCKIVLKKDGEKVGEETSGELYLKKIKDGTYRAEVYLLEHPFLPQDVPWIISNPIFKGKLFSVPLVKERKASRMLPLDLSSLRVEKDESSEASYKIFKDCALLDFHLGGKNRSEEEHWCALALRSKIDLSLYEGIYFRGSSDQLLRFWVELRSGKDWYFASLKLNPGRENRVQIPFDRFYRINGGRERPPLKDIDSLFITFNTSNLEPGVSGRLCIREMGFFEEEMDESEGFKDYQENMILFRKVKR